jgi:DNA-binding HxlR family transcriptional regulator
MNNPCSPYHKAIELIGRRWTGVLIMALMDGPQRFSQLAAAVPGVSDRLLSERLKELEAHGIVHRTVEPGPPVGVSYELTAMGADLRSALSELQAWARRWLENPPPTS